MSRVLSTGLQVGTWRWLVRAALALACGRGGFRVAVACAALGVALSVAMGAVAAQPGGNDAAGAGAGGSGSAGGTRPVSAGRVVRVFDFEERADRRRPDFNPEPVPVGWVRAQADPPRRERVGFPAANRAGYDVTRGASGQVSLRLPTQGGSTSLRLSSGVLAVFPDADYSVTAVARTEGLVHARAFIEARLVDASGRVIEASRRRSAPVDAGLGWTPLRVQVPGGFSQAAFLQIELLLLQPERFQPAPVTGRHHVWAEDRSGAAWFDDVAVVQLPQVTLTGPRADGTLTWPAPARLTVTVRDLTGDAMTAALTLRDLDGAELAAEERALPAGGGRFEWAPALPSPGWYEARLEVRAGAQVIGAARCPLVVWPALAEAESVGPSALTPAQAARWGLALAAAPGFADGVLPGTLRTLQNRSLTLPLGPLGAAPLAREPGEGEGAAGSVGGGSEGDGSEEAVGPTRALLDALLAEQVQLTLELPGVAEERSRELQVDRRDTLEVLAGEASAWMPGLRPVLDVYGQRVRRWHVGPGRDGFPPGPELGRRVRAFRAELSKLVPGPIISVPWRAEWDWPGESVGPVGSSGGGVDELAVRLTETFPPEAIPELVSRWRAARAGARASVAVLMPGVDAEAEAEQGDHRAAVSELARRTVWLWAALSRGEGEAGDPAAEDRPTLPQPWTVDEAARQLRPVPALAAWRTLTAHLGGRRVLDELAAGSGLRCFVLAEVSQNQSLLGRGEARRPGALVLWNESAPPGEGRDEFSAFLGPGPLYVVDLFGNRTRLEPVDAAGLYRLTARETPVFVEGIDPELALFIRGVRVQPELVAAVATEHEHELVLINPWPVRVTGQVQLTQAPETPARRAWRFTPTAPMSFAIEPGGEARLPFSFSFSAAEEAGPRTLHARVRVTAERAYQPLRVTAPLVIGLANLELVTSVMLSPGPEGPDVVVVATVTNTGTRPRTMQIDALAPDRPQQQQPVSNLAPGASIDRRFVFRDAAAALRGKRVRVSLSDVEGAERLNRSVVVP